MSGRLLRLVCTTTVTAGAMLAPAPAAAVPDPGAAPTATATKPGTRSVANLLTDLQRLYRDAEKATETYNATAEKLKKQQAKVARLDGQLSRARLSLQDSRGAAGRLAREQYQGGGEISSYVRLLLARDPQHALDQGHLIRQLSQERAETVDRLVGSEQKSDALARKARKALDGQLALAGRQKKERDDVRGRLRRVENLLASLRADQLAQLVEFEKTGMAQAQKKFMASGALSSARTPSKEGEEAVQYAVRQLGKPYEWGAQGPKSYDCSGLTSQAWEHAGRAIPRTSQEQWARLPRLPLKELRPGDLVVYFPEATHVALYIGDGLVVQAPRPGANVKVSPIAANPILGAVRPDPTGESLRHYAPPLPGDATDGSNEGYGKAGAPR